MTKVIVTLGDITEQAVDAIVNPANKWLGKGGGVTGAIHRKAGPKFTEECYLVGRCETAEAKLTRGHNLPARHVIHTVGPEYGFEKGSEAEILRLCYRNTLHLAKKHNIKTLAFPSIATGSFRYPPEEAVPIALSTIKEFIGESDHFEEIRFVLFSEEIFHLYKEGAKEVLKDYNSL